MYSGAPNKIPDPYTGYPIGSEQHRIHVQRLHEEAERERRAIEDKLMRLRDVDMVRRKQKEYENMVNSQNQNQNQYVNQRQQQQQQQQQQQYQFHNNHHTNHDNNFQIMDRHTDHIRQPPQHTSSSSKSNNSNYAHERSHDRSHERYDGMIKSDSRSGKIKKLKSVVEIPRRIIKKSTFAYLMRNTFLVHFWLCLRIICFAVFVDVLWLVTVWNIIFIFQSSSSSSPLFCTVLTYGRTLKHLQHINILCTVLTHVHFTPYTEVNNYSAPSYTAAVPWDDRPMVEKKLERRLRDKERSDEAATRDTGSNRAPPGIGDIQPWYDVHYICAWTYLWYVICCCVCCARRVPVMMSVNNKQHFYKNWIHQLYLYV